MKKFDLANFIGRFLLSIYFIINSLQFFWMTKLLGVQDQGIGFWLLVAVLEFAAGIMLLFGIKPRVAAAVLGSFLLLKLLVSVSGIGATAWEQWQFYPPNSMQNDTAANDIPFWASFHAQYVFSQLALLGGCIFVIGARFIPHSVMARDEANLLNKYGE